MRNNLNYLKFLMLHSLFCHFYQKKYSKVNGSLRNFGTYYSWWNHQMDFKMFVLQNAKSKSWWISRACVTYMQPNFLSLDLGSTKNLKFISVDQRYNQHDTKKISLFSKMCWLLKFTVYNLKLFSIFSTKIEYFCLRDQL